MKNGFILGAVASSLVLALPATAQTHRYVTVYGSAPDGYYALPPGPGASAEQWNQYDNNYSGTLGRQGLGADPRHPEGPGNASSPR